jgi:hypothetical protein
MSWFKGDDNLPNNHKLENLSVPAKFLYVCSLAYCARNLTDGALTARAVKIVRAECPAAAKHVGELADAGLWDRAADGYIVHDYLEYNPTREQVLAERKARSDAGRLGGIRSGEARRQASASANGVAKGQASGLNPVPSRKDQKPLEATIRFELEKAALTGTA